jgi:Flp pilus assembly protein TadG
MRRRAQRGNVLVEFTLSLTLLTTLFTGAWQFGYSYYIYAELEQAVRNGARYASLQKYDSATSTPTPAFLSAVQNVVVYGDPAAPAGSTPAAPGLTTGNVGLTVSFAGGVPTGMTVAVNNYRMPAVFNQITLINKPTTWFPYVGTFGPP